MSLLLPANLQLTQSCGFKILDLVNFKPFGLRWARKARIVDTISIIDVGRYLYHYPPIFDFIILFYSDYHYNSLHFQVSPNVCVRVAVCG